MPKPVTTDGINYTLHGCLLKVLTIDDIIEKDDFIRPLVESSMFSQVVGWDKKYKDDKWEGPKWHRVRDDLPAWIGRTYADFLMFPDGEMIDEPIDEIVRVMSEVDNDEH